MVIIWANSRASIDHRTLCKCSNKTKLFINYLFSHFKVFKYIEKWFTLLKDKFHTKFVLCDEFANLCPFDSEHVSWISIFNEHEMGIPLQIPRISQILYQFLQKILLNIQMAKKALINIMLIWNNCNINQ